MDEPAASMPAYRHLVNNRLVLVAFTTLATVAYLQAYRVFVPYLIFEVDQSERVKLAQIAAAVFALTFLGTVLFRLFGPRWTLVMATGCLGVTRVALQLTEDPGYRWVLGAGAIVAWSWIMLVILPTRSRDVAAGIGFAFLLDLMLRAARGTLDLPWMPGTAQLILTIAIVGLLAVTLYALFRSDAVEPREPPFASCARFIGIGSGVGLWLVAAGNLGFAELHAGRSLPAAFALIAVGVLGALLFVVQSGSPSVVPRRERRAMLVFGLIGAAVAGIWAFGEDRGDDLLVVAFSFVVTALTMYCATTEDQPTIAGRWRTGAAVTIGLLLQAACVFLYFAQTGPIELYLAPIAILTVVALIGPRAVPDTSSNRAILLRAAAVVGVLALLVTAWLVIDEPETSNGVADASNLTVMTFNIQEGFSNENIWSLEETARTIEASNPDIVILQETTRGWLVMSSVDEVRWLADRLDMEYAYAGHSHDGLWGNAILSRLPIVSTDSVDFSTTDNLRRGAVAIEVETGDGNLLVIDTHLDNPKTAADVRLEQIEELIEFWGGTEPAVIAGDFNADPGSPEWQAMIDAGLVDTGEGSTETTSEDERRIDYIFVTPDLQVDSYNVPEVWTSDHRPVVVELSLSP